MPPGIHTWRTRPPTSYLTQRPPRGSLKPYVFPILFAVFQAPPLSRPLPHCYDFDTYEDEGGGKSSSEVGKLERWEVGKMGSWKDGKLQSCEVGKLGSCEAGKLGCCKVGKLESCEAGKLGCCNVGKLESCKAGRLGCWEGGRLKVCLSCLI